jgi:hypothetical protein
LIAHTVSAPKAEYRVIAERFDLEATCPRVVARMECFDNARARVVTMLILAQEKREFRLRTGR